jgi:hypothetical protein
LSDQNRVVKFKKRRSINIGIIVFLILFLYIAINVYIYFTKEQLSIYEVQEGGAVGENLITGIILRNEKVVKTNQAGYITYYQKEGARVAKNSPVYSVNENGQLQNVITSGDVPITLSPKNSAELKHEVQNFQATFSDNNFSYVYDFKENAQSTVLDILNSAMIENSATLTEESGIMNTNNMIPSEESGIVTYYIDSYEAFTADTLTPEDFKPNDYKRTSLRTTSAVTRNSPVYKLIESDSWSIIIPLSKDQYSKLKDKKQVTFTVKKDDLDIAAKISLLQKGSDYYAQLTMNRYLSNYLNDRFIELELHYDTVQGLKIPKTSVLEKEFYLVPFTYFSLGADSNDDGLIVESYDSKTGEVTYSFVATDIYYMDDTYAYVDADLFSLNTSVRSATKDSDRYQLNKMGKLTGVYNVNMGYAVFKRIEILEETDEYYIIANNTPNGLSAYDHIALDSKTAVEQKIIY